MVCKKCGSVLEENENFCGECGTQIFNTDEQYHVYNYNERLAKDNSAYMSYGQVIKDGILLSLPLIIGAILIGLFIEDGPAMFIAEGVLIVVMMTIVIVAAIQMSKYLNAPLLAIVYDKKEGIHYIVQHAVKSVGGWNTASRAASVVAQGIEREELSKKAQEDALLINIVEQYKAGEIERSTLEKVFVTPDQIVTKLTNPKVVKSNKKQIVVSYEKEDGGRKKIRIVNAYPGFKI